MIYENTTVISAGIAFKCHYLYHEGFPATTTDPEEPPQIEDLTLKIGDFNVTHVIKYEVQADIEQALLDMKASL